MLVYGDPKFEAPLDILHRQLSAYVRRTQAHPNDLGRLRALLIACGQVEQGVHDAWERRGLQDEAKPLIASLHAATAHAAEAFYSLAHAELSSRHSFLPPPRVEAAEALRQAERHLGGMDHLPSLSAAVKLPEGFNLHTVYPEQYVVAAGHWLAGHEGQQARGAIVVGIRSIGTTLAAAVATVLRAGGWQVQSLTVRPHGHPYARAVELANLDRSLLNSANVGLVVDEGPGISGSSLAAAASALVKAGLDVRQIAFLPGHPNDPGGAGSPEVRRWWQEAPRYVTPSEALTFGGLALPQALAAAIGIRPVRIDNVSGGVWRQYVYTDKEKWPAVCNQFERVKYLCTAADGSQVLFKFHGLAAGSARLEGTAQESAALLSKRAAQELAPQVRGTALGFVATEWLEGAPLGGQPTPSDVPAQIGTYIACVAGSELAADALADATERLTEMIYVNTTEACGAAVADKARRLRPGADCLRASYGDGHLQPYEWIRTPDGAVRKVDGTGHDCDHTLIGKQPVAWDLAGAVIEWQLSPEAVGRLLRAYVSAGGQPIDAPSLAFYSAAYLAFRAGQCLLAAQAHDPYERDRLLAAYEGYRGRLLEHLR